MSEEELSKQKHLEDIKTVLENPAGRRVIRKILKDNYLFLSCYDENEKVERMRMGRQGFARDLYEDCLRSAKELTKDMIIQ